MKKTTVKIIDKLVSKVIRANVNSTTSIIAYQPRIPAEIKNETKSK